MTGICFHRLGCSSASVLGETSPKLCESSDSLDSSSPSSPPSASSLILCAKLLLLVLSASSRPVCLLKSRSCTRLGKEHSVPGIPPHAESVWGLFAHSFQRLKPFDHFGPLKHPRLSYPSDLPVHLDFILCTPRYSNSFSRFAPSQPTTLLPVFGNSPFTLVSDFMSTIRLIYPRSLSSNLAQPLSPVLCNF